MDKIVLSRARMALDLDTRASQPAELPSVIPSPGGTVCRVSGVGYEFGGGAEGGPLQGEFTSGFWVRLGFPLKSKSNFRRSSSSPASWRGNRAFEDSVAHVVRSYRPAGWVLPDRDQRLADRPLVVAAIAARSLLDPGNYSKSLLDALEGTLFTTDASVAAVACIGCRARDNQDAVAAFAQLPARTNLKDVARVSSMLLESATSLL